MAKLLLVEDDNNLREIYEARLSAEGYEISTAQNGEEALSIAKQVHPDLIISDVMMPRISGFEMLDILRNTDELRNTKIIMLTALGQAEDRGRADNLGADKYLVKSQVTLEDIVQAAHDLLAGTTAQPVATPSLAAVPDPAEPVQMPVVEQPAMTQPIPAPVAPMPEPQAAPTPVIDYSSTTDTSMPVQDDLTDTATQEAVSLTEQEAAIQRQIENFATEVPTEPVPAVQPEFTVPDPAKPVQMPVVEQPAMTQPIPAPVAPMPEPQAAPTPVIEPVAPAHDSPSNDAVLEAAIDKLTDQTGSAPQTPQTVAASSFAQDYNPSEPSGRKVISPITDPTSAPNLDDLLAKEEASEIDVSQPIPSVVPPSPTSNAAIIAPKPGDSVDPNSIAL